MVQKSERSRGRVADERRKGGKRCRSGMRLVHWDWALRIAEWRGR